MPFNPTVDIFVSSPAPSANSNLRIATSLAAGNHALGTWNFTLPSGWDVSPDNAVFDGDVIARGAMSVDTDCNGSVETYGPFNLVDLPVSPPDAPVAQWTGQITSWWSFLITVDQLPGEPLELNADLTNLSVFHELCAPQTLIITVLGRSIPHNDIVLANPSSAATHTWTGSFTSFGGAHMTNVNEPVCIGNSCDRDSDGVADVGDICDTWPNPAQNLPPWPVPADDPDCDGFNSAVEDPVGANPLVQCGFNAWPADITNDTFSDTGDIGALTANFGAPVPPAPARHNIAPDPVDGFIDTGDIGKMTAFFGMTCAPCAGDLDCDLVLNAADNCPNWPNPSQNLPPWPLPANDPDCDGFSSAVETSAGTNPLAHCGADAWPADITNNGFSDTGDIGAVTSNFGLSVPPAPARYNIAPVPNGFIDTGDIGTMTAFFGKTCQ